MAKAVDEQNVEDEAWLLILMYRIKKRGGNLTELLILRQVEIKELENCLSWKNEGTTQEY